MRVPGLKLALAFLVGALALPGLSHGQDLTKSQLAEVRRFAANNSLFVLYHEMAHLLFDQLQMPILGREEDAADNMATWIMLNKRDPVMDTALADAAQGWLLSGITYDSGGEESDFAAAHSLDKQRAYAIVCMMVGMDGAAFEPIANEYAMDGDRQSTCFLDYSTIDRSLRGLLSSHGNKSGRGTEVYVNYHDAGGGRLKEAADAFRSSGIFDDVAHELRDNYNLGNRVLFNAKRCGEPNAFYDPITVEVIFCYELMADYMDLYAAELPTAVSPAPRSTGAGQEKTSNF
jgi:hypothetical protein